MKLKFLLLETRVSSAGNKMFHVIEHFVPIRISKLGYERNVASGSFWKLKKVGKR